nr:MAG TPA: hypothetical protein [Caudoviricetes sp.]
MLYCGRLGIYSLLLINASNFCSITIVLELTSLRLSIVSLHWALISDGSK